MSARSTERDVASFLAKYAPLIALQLRQGRAILHRLFPRGFELIYDNYNALVFGFGPTLRASDAVLSLAGYPKWTTLFFLKGATLSDLDGLLQGKGSQVRSIRLSGAADLETREIQALIAQAVATQEIAFAEAPPLSSAIKSVSATQRPRRPQPHAVVRTSMSSKERAP